MILPGESKMQSRARVIKSLAHPTRLLAIDELMSGRKSVGQLADAAACDISTMSRHLAVLRAAGIVAVEKSSNTVLCRLATPCIADFFSCIDRVLSGDSEPCGPGSSQGRCGA